MCTPGVSDYIVVLVIVELEFDILLFQSRGELSELAELPDPADLVTISQSRCSASDLLRMEAILATKLENKQQQVSPVLILLGRDN